jgi:hypothetical protein
MRLLRYGIPLAILAATGCATSSGRCTGEFEYQKAQNLPLPPAQTGVKLPESGSALRIPGEVKQPVAFAEPVPDPQDPKKQKTRCLDTPPSMPSDPPAVPAVTSTNDKSAAAPSTPKQ